ncbi:MAG: glycosyltransferase [Collinsella aerofaciens]
MFENSKYEVIYNAIDCDQFRYSPDIRKEIRQELGIHEHVQVIGHIGRFCQQKNQAYLLDLLQAILAERKDVLLMMIGDGDDKPAVAAEVKYRNLDEHIIILPNTTEIWRYYQAFDIFVLPSLYEGLGMVAIEAQLAGLPCILSDNVRVALPLGAYSVSAPR